MFLLRSREETRYYKLEKSCLRQDEMEVQCEPGRVYLIQVSDNFFPCMQKEYVYMSLFKIMSVNEVSVLILDRCRI